MPTAGRLFAAIAFAAVAFLAGLAYMPLQPPEVQFGNFLYVSAAMGAFIGWLVMGRRSGRGWRAAMESGLATAAVMLGAITFVFSMREMLLRALDGRYRGPMEALTNTFAIMIEYGAVMADLRFVLTLVVGGLIGGLVSEAAEKRWH